jgi:hypothetical protein
MTLSAKASQALAAQSTGGSASIQSETKILRTYANAAPSAIRSDLQVFADAFASYAQALKKAGYKAGAVPTTAQITAIAGAAKSFGSPKLKNAELHLSAWAHKNCNVPTATSP